MPFLLPLATILTAAITVKTIDKTTRKMSKRKKRKYRNEL